MTLHFGINKDFFTRKPRKSRRRFAFST